MWHPQFSVIAVLECIETDKTYIGRRHCTQSGRSCQPWSNQTPHKHKFTNDTMFPDGSVIAASAYCRNPGLSRDSPWCYTQDENVDWEYCDLPKCSGNNIHNLI